MSRLILIHTVCNVTISFFFFFFVLFESVNVKILGSLNQSKAYKLKKIKGTKI